MKETKNNIPELRFPEFNNPWEIITVSDVCDVFRGGAFSKADMNKNGTELCIHYGELFTKYNEIISDIYSRTNKSDGFRSQIGDILMPSSDVTPDGLAKASAIILKDVILGGDMNILRPKININSIFLSYLLNHSKKEIIKLVSGTTVKHIYPSQIITCRLPIVNNIVEQQKIASCLSSLDEVIAAYSQKLEALKAHKKGLMQNLFPSAIHNSSHCGLDPQSPKTPNYRFPEFVGDGDWVEKKLGDIGEPLMCKRILKEQTISNPKNGVPFYKIGTFGRIADSYISQGIYNDFKSKYSFPNIGDILISAAGTIGRLVIFDGLPAYFQDSNIVWLGNNETLVLNSYLFHYYSKIKWQTSDGGIISRLYNSDLKNMKIHFPKGKIEQHKIASCLSSLDELITAQAEKIEQLKLHKKGLMQGLFPKANND